MPDQLQLRGGTTTEHNTFTGASKEVTVDTTKKTAVVHDGTTAGGNPLMREDGANSGLIAGSAGSPSLKFDGDTDTGVYSPGADQLAISTNGTGRLFVDASGNVGVKTDSPSVPLEIARLGSAWAGASPIAETALFVNSGSASATSPARVSILSGNASLAAIYFGDTDNNSKSIIQFDNTNDSLQFNVNGSERLRITSTGEFEFTGAGSAGTTQAVYFSGSAPVNSLVIDSTGKVGLGTSSPDELLHIEGDTAEFKGTNTNPISDTAGTEQIFKFGIEGQRNSVYGPAGSIIFRQDGASWSNTTPAQKPTRIEFCTQDETATDQSETPRLVIDKDGNVGIGTTSPANKLHVEGDISVGTEGGTGPYSLYWASTTGGQVVKWFRNDGGSFAIGRGITSGTNEELRIDNSGRLLVGTSSWAGGNAAFVIKGQPASGPGIQYLSYALPAANITNNTTLGYLYFSGRDGEQGASIRAVSDDDWAASDYPTRLVFSTTADGASSPTERMRITNDGAVFLHTTSATVDSSNFGTNFRADNRLLHARDIDGAGAVVQLYGNAGELRILGDGDLQNTNNSYTGISDIKLKESIVDASSQWNDLKALQVRNYNFKPETGYNTHTQIGLIAQEVELVSPGLVGESINEETGESTKSVNYSVLYMKAVKALQEAMERIEVLEAKVNALEGN